MFNALSLLFQSLNKRLICWNFSAFFLLNDFLKSVKVILLIPIRLVVFSLLFTTTLIAKKRLVSGDDILFGLRVMKSGPDIPPPPGNSK